MELISEILLSSPDEKNEIRERSSALKKFKLNGAVEVKPASSQSPTNPKEAQDSKEPGTPSAQPKKPEDQPFVSKKGLFEEIPKPNTTPMSKPSALIKIPVSAIQQGADEVPQDSQKWRETPTTNSSGKGITELVQLRKELERIRERIASPAT